MMNTALQIGIGVLILLLFCIRETLKPADQKWNFFTGRKSYKLPPGPKGIPLYGNLKQFLYNRHPQRLTPYLTSLRTHGELTTLRLGSQTWILLNSKRVAAHFISKSGRLTNERPHMPIASGLVSNNKRTVIRQTASWSEGRRVMHHLLSGSVLKTYGNWMEFESLSLLNSYLRQPERWYAHHFRYSTAVLYRLVMGEKLDKSKEELDKYQQVTMEFVRSIGLSVVDFFPELDMWVPKWMQPWRRFWSEMGRRHRGVFVDWWTPIYEMVKKGEGKAGFVRDTLLHPEVKYKGDEEEAMYLATSVIAAGGDNTRMSLNTFVMSMVSNPEILKRGRAEIDRLCGADEGKLRLPGADDMEQLPYVSAIIKEVLRWRPTVPLVPPHQLTEDIEFEGYVFPKGVSFVLNTISISQEYENWDDFNPERWMDGNEDNVTHDLWAFGGGRRICVGYRVAQQALFVAVARLIFCFNITARGEIDNKNLNHVSLNEPFPVQVTVRSPAHETLILSGFDKAAKEESSQKMR